MRQLLPEARQAVDVVALYEASPRPSPADRPWVLVNMIASVDGATAVDGVSGGLGGPADKEVFRAVRALPDVILVAAGTVRAERYGPPRLSAATQRQRAARGQRPSPRLAIVTARLDLDPQGALFQDATEDARPIVLTTDAAAASAPDALHAVADIWGAGDAEVDLGGALRRLGVEARATTVLCEGGPSLNGELVASGLVDELFLSVAPLLVGGGSARMAHGPTGTPLPLSLDHVLEDDGVLFLHYRRLQQPPQPS